MKNEYGLTEKMENFCQEVFAQGNASDAYAEAYDTQNMSRRVISVKACELMKKPEIKARIEMLRKELADNIQVDQSFIANMFLDAAKKAAEKGDQKTTIKAGEALAKLLGLFEADKLNIGGSGGFNIQIVNPLTTKLLNKPDKPSEN